MKGPLRRRLPLWMLWPKTSLPTPDSPQSSTVASVREARTADSLACSISGAEARMLSKVYSVSALADLTSRTRCSSFLRLSILRVSSLASSTYW